MARRKTELNLTPELPEIRSTDFNLFYRPEAKPVDKSITLFTQSLDRFVNNAGTGLVLRAEQKEKELNEAKAIKQFNENRTGFNNAVKKGEIPKEANPYFQEKYKELTLNKKAQEFQTQLYKNYAEMNVLDNPDPQAFDKFYNDQIKQFVASNNLGSFDALQLEKGFFSETSKTRNSLFNTHVNSQLSKIGEDYKLNFKESIQGKFNKNISNAEIGADISAFVQDAVTNGLSKSTAQKYLLESLKEYAETTSDLDFAERLLRDLPKHIKLGTDAIGNVKGLENDFDEIKEKIDDRILQEEKDKATELSTANTIETFEASNFADKYETYSQAIQDPEWNSFSRSKKDKIFKEYESREVGFDTQTDPRVEEDIKKLLLESKYDDAMELLKANVPNVTGGFYSKMKEEIQDFKFTEKDGLLASDYFVFFKSKVEGFTEQIARKKFGVGQAISGLEHEKFEATIRKWLKENTLSKYNNSTVDRETAFNKFVKEKFDEIQTKVLADKEDGFADGKAITLEGEGNGTPIIVNPKDLK
ncbi:hypothetical protein HTVC041P_gp35 [Pelagibacter phage HTVC041P]|uniref:Uncharacterized protein n=1 Tax=Pelagibacter phage HTVC041P TaxID=3072833 RepID=A0AAX4G2R3_9CAUD|nr:hypothetical protein HTVC041P_gp35 [Pelagibacter phage HTVC041P]